MNLQPGGIAVVDFNAELQGNLTGIGTATAVVFRNGALTSIVPTITSDIAGHYSVSFTVPANWIEYDKVSVRLSLEWGTGGETIACTKDAGVVTITPITTEFLADLLVADQVKTVVGGVTTISYYEQGTNQSVLLHAQVQTGDPCEGDVSLIAV